MIILGNNNNKDKFGYYKVGDFKTYSKIEACELHAMTGHFPEWKFNEEVFLNYDWSVEPLESLDELYRRRAQQIRDTYDYVVLFYSGGADSGNILDTFVDHGIAFDEIATYNYHKADSNNIYFHSEQKLVSYPKIQSLQQQGLNFRHRFIDLSDLAHKILMDQHYTMNRAYYSASHWGLSHLARSYIRETTPDYISLMEKGKKIAFVFGAEKPRLYQVDGRYCIRFLDMVDSCVSVRTMMLGRENEYDELFYWAPEAVDIVCKQGHVLKNFFRKYDLYREDKYYSEDLVQLPNVTEMFSNRYTEDGLGVTHRNLINMLIYPKFRNDTYTVGKPQSSINSKRDAVWNKDSIYKKQLAYIREHLLRVDPCWIRDPNDIDSGLHLCLSPPYFLEK